MVKVKNLKDRYYNWARKWDILIIDDSKLQDYLNAWFELVEEKETPENPENPKSKGKGKKEIPENPEN